MNKFFISMILVLSSIHSAHAQTIGTIGIGETSYVSAKHNQALGSKANILSDLNTQIETALLKTRKFNVLDHDQLIDLLDSRVLNLDSFNYSVEHTSVFLQAGLDYVLKADIVNLDVYTQKRGSRNTSTGLIEINLYLQGVSHSTDDVKQTITTQVPLQLGSQGLNSTTQQIINAGVEKVVNHIITQLFPVRVVQIYEDERIKLNYGNGQLSVGDTINLYEESRVGEVYDTLREPLKRAEIVLQVVSVDKRFAIAQALGGFDKIEKRMVGKVQLNEF